MNKNIPSEEEFARASQLMKDRAKNLDKVKEAILGPGNNNFQLHNYFILDQNDVNFRAYVFFETEAQLKANEESGTTLNIEEQTYKELERFGRGKRKEITVAFEFDSFENVKQNFEGDYYNRLR